MKKKRFGNVNHLQRGREKEAQHILSSERNFLFTFSSEIHKHGAISQHISAERPLNWALLL